MSASTLLELASGDARLTHDGAKRSNGQQPIASIRYGQPESVGMAFHDNVAAVVLVVLEAVAFQDAHDLEGSQPAQPSQR